MHHSLLAGIEWTSLVIVVKVGYGSALSEYLNLLDKMKKKSAWLNTQSCFDMNAINDELLWRLVLFSFGDQLNGCFEAIVFDYSLDCAGVICHKEFSLGSTSTERP